MSILITGIAYINNDYVSKLTNDPNRVMMTEIDLEEIKKLPVIVSHGKRHTGHDKIGNIIDVHKNGDELRTKVLIEPKYSYLIQSGKYKSFSLRYRNILKEDNGKFVLKRNYIELSICEKPVVKGCDFLEVEYLLSEDKKNNFQDFLLFFQMSEAKQETTPQLESKQPTQPQNIEGKPDYNSIFDGYSIDEIKELASRHIVAELKRNKGQGDGTKKKLVEQEQMKALMSTKIKSLSNELGVQMNDDTIKTVTETPEVVEMVAQYKKKVDELSKQNEELKTNLEKQKMNESKKRTNEFESQQPQKIEKNHKNEDLSSKLRRSMEIFEKSGLMGLLDKQSTNTQMQVPLGEQNVPKLQEDVQLSHDTKDQIYDSIYDKYLNEFTSQKDCELYTKDLIKQHQDQVKKINKF